MEEAGFVDIEEFNFKVCEHEQTVEKAAVMRHRSWLNYDLDTSRRLARGRKTETGRAVCTVVHRAGHRGLRATDGYDAGLVSGRNPRLYRPYQARGALTQVPPILLAEDCMGKKAGLVRQ